MKNILFAVSLLFSCSLFAADVELTAENVRVVVPADACPVVRFAADELTNFLAQAFGAPVRIVNEKSTVQPSTSNLQPGPVYITLGGPDERLPLDAFVIDVKPNEIRIAGNDDPRWDPYQAFKAAKARTIYERGTLNGMYAFLERFAGCRFYFPGPLGTVVPHADRLTVPVGRIREAPDFVKREWYEATGRRMEGDETGLTFGQFGFLQALRHRRWAANPQVHGFRFMQFKERFAKEHPEYFALRRNKDGSTERLAGSQVRGVNICWSSGIIDEIAKDCIAYFRFDTPELRGFGTGWPDDAFFRDVVCLTPDDGMFGCECDDCRKWYPNGEKKGAYASELVWAKTAYVARKLQEAGVKGWLDQSAYVRYADIPQLTSELPTNVLVKYCCTGPWDERNPGNREKRLGELKTWFGKTHHMKLHLHNWELKWGPTKIPMAPCITPHACGSYFARVAPYADGVYLEAASDRYAHMYLSTYIAAKTTWNAKFDYDAAIAEHHRLMFGPAEKEMAAFFEDCERLWAERIMGGVNEMGDWGPIQHMPSEDEIWGDIYSKEKLAEWMHLFEVAEVKVRGEGDVISSIPQDLKTSKPDNLYRRRVELMRRNILVPLEEEAKTHWRKQAAPIAY